MVLAAAILLAISNMFFSPTVKYEHTSIEYPKHTAYIWHAKKHIDEMLKVLNAGYGIEVYHKNRAKNFRYWIEKDKIESGILSDLKITKLRKKKYLIHNVENAVRRLRGCIPADVDNPQKFSVKESKPCAKFKKKRMRQKNRNRLKKNKKRRN
jgi:hypothetical protein